MLLRLLDRLLSRGEVVNTGSPALSPRKRTIPEGAAHRCARSHLSVFLSVCRLRFVLLFEDRGKREEEKGCLVGVTGGRGLQSKGEEQLLKRVARAVRGR